MGKDSLYDNLSLEIAILIGILGFFIGGLITATKSDMINVVIGASVTGFIVFFITYFIVEIFLNLNENEKGIKDAKKNSDIQKKGKNIDITVDKLDETMDIQDIYNLK